MTVQIMTKLRNILGKHKLFGDKNNNLLYHIIILRNRNMIGLQLLWQKWFAYLFGLGSPSLSSSFEGRSGTLATKSFKKSNWFSDVIHLFLWIQTIPE
jgi:hypothetical protein